MLNLISGNVLAALKITNYSPTIGMLASPYVGNSIQHAVTHKISWAIDNGCFVRYDPRSIARSYESAGQIARIHPPLFAVIPDWFDREQMRGGHHETMLMMRAWLPRLQLWDLPPAFVLQNGATMRDVPFGSIAALFIGGDTEYKLSREVQKFVAIAKNRGLWVHMGRVNSRQRALYAASIGCDSADGGGYARFMRDRLLRDLPAFQQIPLFRYTE